MFLHSFILAYFNWVRGISNALCVALQRRAIIHNNTWASSITSDTRSLAGAIWQYIHISYIQYIWIVSAEGQVNRRAIETKVEKLNNKARAKKMCVRTHMAHLTNIFFLSCCAKCHMRIGQCDWFARHCKWGRTHTHAHSSFDSQKMLWRNNFCTRSKEVETNKNCSDVDLMLLGRKKI